jgi:hypothetical protein
LFLFPEPVKTDIGVGSLPQSTTKHEKRENSNKHLHFLIRSIAAHVQQNCHFHKQVMMITPDSNRSGVWIHEPKFCGRNAAYVLIILLGKI